MLRKLSVLAVITISSAAFVVAQQTESKPQRIEGRATILIESGAGGYLGIQTQDVSRENYAKFGLAEVRGAAVEKVVENSPAAQAGLQNGDVILRYNGEEVSSVRKLTRLIAETAPDHKVSLTIWRSGGEREITVTVGKRETPKFNFSGLNFENFPQMEELPATPRAPFPAMPNGELRGYAFRTGERRQIGINVTALSKQLADYFGAANGKGLLIDSVVADSPAAKAGLKAGDVITEADGKEVGGNVDLIRALNEKKEGDVTLTVIRDKNRQTVNVTPETVKNAPMRIFENFEGFGDAPGAFRMSVPQTPKTPTAPIIPITPRIL